MPDENAKQYGDPEGTYASADDRYDAVMHDLEKKLEAQEELEEELKSIAQPMQLEEKISEGTGEEMVEVDIDIDGEKVLEQVSEEIQETISEAMAEYREPEDVGFPVDDTPEFPLDFLTSEEQAFRDNPEEALTVMPEQVSQLDRRLNKRNFVPPQALQSIVQPVEEPEEAEEVSAVAETKRVGSPQPTRTGMEIAGAGKRRGKSQQSGPARSSRYTNKVYPDQPVGTVDQTTFRG